MHLCQLEGYSRQVQLARDTARFQVYPEIFESMHRSFLGIDRSSQFPLSVGLPGAPSKHENTLADFRTHQCRPAPEPGSLRALAQAASGARPVVCCDLPIRYRPEMWVPVSGASDATESAIRLRRNERLWHTQNRSIQNDLFASDR